MDAHQDLSLSLHPSLPPPQAALHSVRKPPVKPWRKPEPPPPKVYRVDPRGFRGLVQRLTGSPKQQQQQQQQQQHHQRVQPDVPRPLRDTVIPPPALQFAPAAMEQQAFVANANTFSAQQRPEAGQQSPGLTGFLSPSWFSPWCSVPLLSPGTVAAMDNSPRAIV